MRKGVTISVDLELYNKGAAILKERHKKVGRYFDSCMEELIKQEALKQ